MHVERGSWCGDRDRVRWKRQAGRTNKRACVPQGRKKGYSRNHHTTVACAQTTVFLFNSRLTLLNRKEAAGRRRKLRPFLPQASQTPPTVHKEQTSDVVQI
eukprot:scaffold2859_cov349-Pavlova_lutheri.AAC.50